VKTSQVERIISSVCPVIVARADRATNVTRGIRVDGWWSRRVKTRTS
jgi:hypothetical protein